MTAASTVDSPGTDAARELPPAAELPPAGEPPPAAELPPVALYVHIPFCISLCPYCDFVVYPGAAARGARSRMAAFVAALLAEIGLRAAAAGAAFGRFAPLETVYIGGGTPSLLSAEALLAIVTAVRRGYGIAESAEITLEANPGPAERGDLRAAAALGITRVSFGAQSFSDAELRTLGRRHRAEDVGDAVRDARDARIGSVNIDLLYDVPGQTEESWARSLHRALGLAPDHLSLYALTLDDPSAEGLTGATGDHLPTPPGARRWRERARLGQDDDRAAAQYQRASDLLSAEGWRGYEISNWARPGHESRHNQAYWRRLPYEAVGPGAHAFDGRARRHNAARLDTYIAALERGRLPPGETEPIAPATAEAETVMLALRTDEGAPAAAADAPRFRDAMAWALANGLAARGADGGVRLTIRGRLLSNEVFLRLI